MDNHVYIVVETRDKNLLDSLVSQLSDKGFEVSLFQTYQIQQNWDELLNVDKLIIALSPGYDIIFYNLSAGRLLNRKRSINLILKSLPLNNEQKKKIGRNKSVFRNLDGEDTAEVVAKIINSENTWQPLSDIQLSEVSQLISIPTFNENDESKVEKGKKKSWLGIVAVALIIGFGIWGYSVYVESEQKAIEENLWNAWDEYLHTESGSMFATLGQALTRKDFDEFRQFGFDNFIEGKIEPSKDISWDDIGPIINGATLYYTFPNNLIQIMDSNLLEEFQKIESSNYTSDGNWNPIADINESNCITISHISISENGKLGKITYFPFNHQEAQMNLEILMEFNDNQWRISDFTNDGLYFTVNINHYFAEQERAKETLYNGNIYTSEGLVPISLKINYNSFPELSAIYKDPSQNLEITMEGEFQDDNLGFYAKINEKDEIGFDLKMEGDNILSGKIILYSKEEESISYDVLLKSEENEEF